ncbi:hypothetical protein D3C75_722720 [compost metagenome]
MNIPAANNGGKNSFNAALEAVFDIHRIFKLCVVQVTPGSIGLREQMTALIHERDISGR